MRTLKVLLHRQPVNVTPPVENLVMTFTTANRFMGALDCSKVRNSVT